MTRAARARLAFQLCGQSDIWGYSMLKKIAFDVAIGTKIAITSALAILLVGGIVASQLIGDARIQGSKAKVDRESAIVTDIIDAKASIRGMQIGVRDLRLAPTPDDLKRANDYLDARRK